ncbi:MAG: hypothetical protein ACXVH6_05805, partial [Halobacteriota archaeon]
KARRAGLEGALRQFRLSGEPCCENEHIPEQHCGKPPNDAGGGRLPLWPVPVERCGNQKRLVEHAAQLVAAPCATMVAVSRLCPSAISGRPRPRFAA